MVLEILVEKWFDWLNFYSFRKYRLTGMKLLFLEFPFEFPSNKIFPLRFFIELYIAL